jgi:hypothetical protein
MEPFMELSRSERRCAEARMAITGGTYWCRPLAANLRLQGHKLILLEEGAIPDQAAHVTGVSARP